MISPLQEHKRRLRNEMRDKRNAGRGNNENSFSKLADIFIRNILLEPHAIVASYAPIRDEIDPSMLDDALRARGHKIALPIIIGEKKSLIFRLYEKGDMLLANPLGILEPASGAKGVEPDVLLIPLLAFDKKRNRLGYGGGYYDRTIKTLRAKKPLLTVGLAYAYQEIDETPIGINDVPLDKIVTELDVC